MDKQQIINIFTEHIKEQQKHSYWIKYKILDIQKYKIFNIKNFELEYIERPNKKDSTIIIRNVDSFGNFKRIEVSTTFALRGKLIADIDFDKYMREKFNRCNPDYDGQRYTIIECASCKCFLPKICGYCLNCGEDNIK